MPQIYGKETVADSLSASREMHSLCLCNHQASGSMDPGWDWSILEPNLVGTPNWQPLLQEGCTFAVDKCSLVERDQIHKRMGSKI